MRSLQQNERTALVVAISLFVALFATVGIILMDDPAPRPPAPVYGSQGATPFIWPGTIRPAVVAAADVRLADDEPIIGVRVHGKARAYRKKAFAGLTNHVVNDLIGTTPVSVTHCDRDGCTRGFTGNGTEPLHIMTGGFSDGLLLRIDGAFYRQSTGQPTADNADPIPYESLALEETTWGKWRAAYPDTDVYIGADNLRPKTGQGQKPVETPSIRNE